MAKDNRNDIVQTTLSDNVIIRSVEENSIVDDRISNDEDGIVLINTQNKDIRKDVVIIINIFKDEGTRNGGKTYPSYVPDDRVRGTGVKDNVKVEGVPTDGTIIKLNEVGFPLDPFKVADSSGVNEDIVRVVVNRIIDVGSATSGIPLPVSRNLVITLVDHETISGTP